MAADAWKAYNSFRNYLGDGTIDLNSNSFKMALFLSTSNAATVTTNTIYANLTNEHANANGYTTGGVALTGVTWTQATSTMTFTCTSPTWTASGGSIVARFAVIYVDGTVNTIVSPLVCFSLLDNTPADVTVTTGNTLTISINASGIFTLTGMA